MWQFGVGLLVETQDFASPVCFICWQSMVWSVTVWYGVACRDARFCVSRMVYELTVNSLVCDNLVWGCLWDARFCVSTFVWMRNNNDVEVRECRFWYLIIIYGTARQYQFMKKLRFSYCYCTHLSLSFNKIGCGSAKPSLKRKYSFRLSLHSPFTIF